MGEGAHFCCRTIWTLTPKDKTKSGTSSNMTAALRFDPIRLPPECERLRKEVRAFLADESAAGTSDTHKPNREATDPPALCPRGGARGSLGRTAPTRYGCHGRSFPER